MHDNDTIRHEHGWTLEQYYAAVCCVTMIRVNAVMANGKTVWVYFMPSDCLDRAADLVRAGARSIDMLDGSLQWTAPPSLAIAMPKSTRAKRSVAK